MAGLHKVEAEMHSSRHNDQSSNHVQPFEVDVGGHRWQVGYDLDDTGKGQVEGVGSVGVELIFGADEVAETDQRPDDAHEDHPDANGVESEQW